MGPLLLWAGGACPLVITCTIGKYLGHKFGCTYATRRSTRCAFGCRQCDAVHIPRLDFGKITAGQRWATYPPFPQVEWDDAEESEFEIARRLKAAFVPPSGAEQDDEQTCPLRGRCAPPSAWSCGNLVAPISA